MHFNNDVYGSDKIIGMIGKTISLIQILRCVDESFIMILIITSDL